MPLLGTVLPIALAVIGRRGGGQEGSAGEGTHEREPPRAFAEDGGFRPATAATPASLAADEGSGNAGTPFRLDEPLTEREIEVLGLLASGRTNSEVARGLFVSVGTVKSHTANIYRKLGSKNRVEAISRARGLGPLR